MGRLGQRKALAFRYTIAVSLFLGGCGSHQKQTKSPEENASDSGKPPPSEEVRLPPLVPADTPPGVVVRFRLRHPRTTAEGVLDAMSLPLKLDELDLFNEEGSAYLRVVDWNAAVEGAIVLNPQDATEPYRFVSLGAKSMDSVLAALESEAIVPEEAPGGVFYFTVRGEPCAVGRSMGSSPARVVCSDQRGALRYLVDYALRGFPNEQLSDADAYLQADLRPVRSRYEKELQRVELLASVGARQLHVGHAKFDRALTDAAVGLAEELSDVLLDTSIIEAELRENQGNLRTALRFHFNGERSTTVRTLREHHSEQGPAPGLFLGLPDSTTYGQYSREIKAERAEPWMSVLADLASGWAEHRGASAEFSTRLSRFMRSLGPGGYTDVLANGPLATVSRNGKPAVRSKWWVLGTTQPKDQLVQTLDDLAWLLASKDFAKVTGEPEYTPALKRLPTTLPLMKGAVVYQWRLPQKTQELKAELAKERRLPSDFDYASLIDELMEGHIAVHEQGGVTWMTWSSEGPPQDLQKTFSSLADAKHTLKDEVELRELLKEPALAAGFFKVDGLSNRLAFLIPPQIAEDWEALLRATPDRGAIPTTFFSRVQKRGAETDLVYQMDVPKKFTRDATTLVTLIITELGLTEK